MKPIAPLVCVCASLLAACSKEPGAPPAPSPEVAVRICKVLKASAAEVKPGGVGFFVQAGLVAKLASEFSGEREVTLNLADNIDAVALKGCAAERATILAAVMKPTLAEAIR